MKKQISKTIEKCLFPVAGYGTRFLPATKAVPKEMLPILTRPLIQYGVEEAYEAGCSMMAFVTSKYKKAIEDHFDTHTDIEASIAGSSKEELLSELNELIERCQFTSIRQREMKGLGHAILTGEPLIGEEPFAVILPDDLCHHDGDGVLKQMIDLYNAYPGHCIVAVEEVPQDQTDKYGIVSVQSSGFGVQDDVLRHSGLDPESPDRSEKILNQVQDDGAQESEPRTPNPELYIIEDMIEKPDPADAPSNLAIIGRYILTPEIFDIIRQTKPGKGGEIQITDALLALAKQGKVLAYRFKGRRFDCGSVDGFVEATNFFYDRKDRP